MKVIDDENGKIDSKLKLKNGLNFVILVCVCVCRRWNERRRESQGQLGQRIEETSQLGQSVGSGRNGTGGSCWVQQYYHLRYVTHSSRLLHTRPIVLPI